ncbi:MAG: histidine kinase [Herpetosiphonaceae bacterium]|nr:histidine kinase [Herpetosiphonaceae bacterium]
MLQGLRLRLTILYTLTALALLLLVGGGMYALTVRYFTFATERALLERMALEFVQLDAPLPPALAAYAPERVLERDNTDRGDLATTFVYPINANGTFFDPNPWAPPITPDQTAALAARQGRRDWRTVVGADGTRVRLLTERLTRDDGPELLQVGRALNEQDAALRQLLLGLVALGGLSTVVVGWASWWLAGRSLVPAQRAWERQQTFVANASHELRAPLTLLRASSEVVLRGLAPNDDNRELLIDVLAETDHMTRLVEDLLLLSRLDAVRISFERTPIAAQELLDEVVRHIGRVAEQQQVTVRVTGAQGRVFGDRARLRQVLLILLDNALRYTPAGGSVLLQAETAGNVARWSVIDTGSGIDASHLPHLFERFYRAEHSRSEQQSGSGLGLSIAQALVVGQGGTISISSMPGRGTTVSLQLPAA